MAFTMIIKDLQEKHPVKWHNWCHGDASIAPLLSQNVGLIPSRIPLRLKSFVLKTQCGNGEMHEKPGARKLKSSALGFSRMRIKEPTLS